MRSTEQRPKYVAFAEALSWIAFRTFVVAADTKERLNSDPAAREAIENAMRQFSVSAGDGRLKVRGRYFAAIGENGLPQAGGTADICEASFMDFQQFDFDLNWLQRRPRNGRRVLGSFSIWTIVNAPDGAAHLTKGYAGTADESYLRAFGSFAGSRSGEGNSLSDGFLDVEVLIDDLVREYPRMQPQPQKATHEEVVAWCLQKIASGTNDMNVAWRDFQEVAMFNGHSRDDCFRPAWKDAKTKL